MVGITAWDTTILDAQRAFRQAWAECNGPSDWRRTGRAVGTNQLAGNRSRLPDMRVTGSAGPDVEGRAGRRRGDVSSSRRWTAVRGRRLQAAALKVRAWRENKPLVAGNGACTTEVTYGCPAQGRAAGCWDSEGDAVELEVAMR